jgi:hypothetical protein
MDRKLGREELKFKTLRLRIKAGAEAMARGEYTDVDDAELEVFLDEMNQSVPVAPHSGARSR